MTTRASGRWISEPGISLIDAFIASMTEYGTADYSQLRGEQELSRREERARD